MGDLCGTSVQSQRTIMFRFLIPLAIFVFVSFAVAEEVNKEGEIESAEIRVAREALPLPQPGRKCQNPPCKKRSNKKKPIKCNKKKNKNKPECKRKGRSGSKGNKKFCRKRENKNKPQCKGKERTRSVNKNKKKDCRRKENKNKPQCKDKGRARSGKKGKIDCSLKENKN